MNRFWLLLSILYFYIVMIEKLKELKDHIILINKKING